MKQARNRAHPSRTELALLNEINRRLGNIEAKVDAQRADAAKTGAIAGAVAGGLTGGLVAAGIAMIKAKFGLWL
ncbi:hypothetical protein [Laribacter hongkongensis]|uniref:Uncharacterized protein n=1 Tax=Laribacter hongkongensis TaxID=168471 RepID=A0ABD4SSB7_9NEIS|nr:hypothetical protein [Laribacter hongkongensis]MCG9026503.1 hypothetical protein [Laribacter hongkongensis]